MQAVAAAAVLALAGGAQAATAAGAAPAQASSAAAAVAAASGASGASAVAPALPVIGRYTIQPGQSLHDVAVDVTQSHDKTTLARASQALFDANPNAFMKHDPSRLKVGATLDVPGTPDMASGASGVTPASAPAPVAAASEPATAAATAAAASAVAAANTAAASGAALASAPEATASATGAASAALASSASATMAASAPAVAAPSSDAHSWSGAVQVAPTSAASAASAPVTVSSLQQLLALKNRVLMALQQHGIGKPAQVAGGAATPGVHGTTAGGEALGANAAQPEVSPITWGVVAAVLLAFVALIVRLLTRKRRKGAAAAEETAAPAVAPSAPIAPLAPIAAYQQTHEEDAHEATQAHHADPDSALDHAAEAASLAAAAELGAEALPPSTFESAHHEATDGPAELHADRTEHDALPHGVEPGEPASLADATGAASLAAAAELGAAALPPESLAGVRTTGEAEELARESANESENESESEAEPPVAGHAAIGAELRAIELTLPGDEVEQPHAAVAHHTEEPQPLDHEIPAEPSAPEAEHVVSAAPAVPDVPAVSQEQEMAQLEVPKEFPQSAVDALGSLDMLPPRVDVPDFPQTSGMPAFSFGATPVAAPETIARQSLPPAEPPAPPAGAAIEAGMAGLGSIAGLAAAMGSSPIGAPPMGTPRFGTLSLDFDLNLPPDSADPLPVFTPEQLSRIARNKLDLAHEYIDLGDLAGARALINEVIESNDHATRADAQALLSTLSPLS
ncbi:FimV/HubP family polar landmark protein [Paraburkholderia sp. Ac-20340]|uniref:FimV/HubP family polar landmark protein n=1 Tax=Paraburkholderia sp. Ac-20340 TaxID=2703888 RepID=UPI001F11D6EC|nr:FimV/HubP family polar landmark protein [Paraburkholderia sp. Ac-20340]